MRMVGLTAVVLGGIALGVVIGDRISAAQQVPPSPVSPSAPASQQGALLTMTMRGAQKSLNDTVKGVLLEHDPPKNWGLLIIGAKGKGQFTCELRSNDREVLFDLQRAILFSREVTVNCAN